MSSFVVLFYVKDEISARKTYKDIDKALNEVVKYDSHDFTKKAELFEVG